MTTRRIVTLTILALMAAGSGLQPAVAQQAASRSINMADLLASVNAYRVSNGLQPVRTDASVTNAARAHARAMAQANVMSHDLGGDLRSRLAAFGVGRATAVENVAWGVNTPAEVMALWRESPGHNQNLLTPDVNRLGVGAAPGPTGTYWALIMAGPSRR